MGDDTTLVITDIKSALAAAEKEARQKSACLLVVGGDLNGTIFDLPAHQSTVFGRNPDNSVVLEFKGVSRRHFKISVDGTDVAILEDLGSANGTYLNNALLSKPRPLRKGDIIKIGSIALKYIPKGDPERLTYDKLHLEANTDGLTKCFNKTYFLNALEVEFKKAKLKRIPLSLIVFDLDHFKALNDNFGHDAGDYVLRISGELIRKNGIRDGDIFARYGGEEFVILLPETTLKQSFEIAERLRILMERHPFTYEGRRLPVSASVGVADFGPGVANGTELFKRADSAVYKSKENGRNQVNFYKPS